MVEPAANRPSGGPARHRAGPRDASRVGVRSSLSEQGSADIRTSDFGMAIEAIDMAIGFEFDEGHMLALGTAPIH